MKSLMDMYNIVTPEDQILIDKLFVSLINKKNYNIYKKIFIHINNKYNNTNMFTVDETNEIVMQVELEKYLNNHFDKYQKNKIFSDSITIELLNNPLLYSKYIKPIINVDENACFSKIKKCFLANNYELYPNYENPYYIKLMMSLFNQMSIKYCKLSIGQMETFIAFFVKQQAFELNLNIDYKLIKISKYFEQLLIKNQRKFAIKRIKEYGTIAASHLKITDGLSLVSFNISNYKQMYFNNKYSLIELLKAIYHECRHALQSNGSAPILSNIDEREQVIIKYDNEYYNKNHNFFEIEVDASIYSIDKRRYTLDHYFPGLMKPTTDDEDKLLFLTNKYQKRFEMEKKVDDLLQAHPKCLKNKYDLQKEYFMDGYPKGIMDILKERSVTKKNCEIIVYNEIITRSLNRMTEPELTEKILFINDACPFYLKYIEEAIKYQIDQLSKVYSFINYEYQKNNINNYEVRTYQNKIDDYNQKIRYYYQQLNLTSQIGVAKR